MLESSEEGLVGIRGVMNELGGGRMMGEERVKLEGRYVINKK
jgi:hypothetical protein